MTEETRHFDSELPDNEFLSERHDALREVLSSMAPLFDSLQILATVKQPDGHRTYNFCKGFGDWYARQGAAQSFLNQDNTKTIAKAVVKEIREGVR